jgi:hypothetical protein
MYGNDRNCSPTRLTMGMYHRSRTERQLGPKARQNCPWLYDKHTLSKLCHVSTLMRTTAWPLPVRTQQPSKGSEMHKSTMRLHLLSIPDLLNPTLDATPITSDRIRLGSISMPTQSPSPCPHSPPSPRTFGLDKGHSVFKQIPQPEEASGLVAHDGVLKEPT